MLYSGVCVLWLAIPSGVSWLRTSRATVLFCGVLPLKFSNEKKSQIINAFRNAQLDSGFSQRWPGFEPRFIFVGFLAEQVALRQVFLKSLGSICQFSFHQLLNFSNLSSAAGAIGYLRPQYKKLCLTSP
jgi:hypothetical protein